MRDHQYRDIEFLVEPPQQNLNLLARFRVQASRWLIGDDDFRVSNDGASDPDSLFLATR